MKHARIIGTGSYLPSHIILNTDLEKTLNTTDAWIFKRTGIRQRHIASAEESASFMGTQAAKQALMKANVSTVDMILVATTTADAFFPSTACLIQNNLGLSGCPAFDIAAACSGFNYALSIADQFIRTGQCKHILVVGSEVMSRLVDWLDPNTCILFGDGAGAVVLEVSDTPGLISSQLYAEGQQHHLLYANNLRSPDPHRIHMKGQAIFRQAIYKMETSLFKLLADEKITIDQIDWLILHQANLNIIQTLAKRLKLPLERVVTTIESHANTSSASIPLALDKAIRDGAIQEQQLLLLGSFGGGLTWGMTLVRY